MSKKFNEKVVEEIMENNNLPESLKANMLSKLEPADVTTEAPEAPKAKKEKPAKASKEPKESKPAIKYDLPAILSALPDSFTPATLDKAFGLNDGGKTVRRHLRNHFAEAMAHNLKDKWTFTKADNSPIIEYFASRYTFNSNALKEVKA